MRVGVLGGTFDPIHYAHLVIAEESLVRLQLDFVLFVPAGRPPHKLDKELTDDEQRVCMVDMAIHSNPGFRLSRVDVERAGPHYSVDTIDLLRRQLPVGTEIYFVAGVDSLSDMPAWHEPQRLIEQVKLAIIRRPDYHLDMAELERVLPGVSSRISWVEAPLLQISSTDIQNRVRRGLPIRYQLPEAVEEYITRHGLYR